MLKVSLFLNILLIAAFTGLFFRHRLEIVARAAQQETFIVLVRDNPTLSQDQKKLLLRSLELVESGQLAVKH